MNIYLTGTCDKTITRMRIENMNLLAPDGKHTMIDYDYAECVASEGVVTLKLKGMYNDDGYLNNKGKQVVKNACLAVAVEIDETKTCRYNDQIEFTSEEQKLYEELLASVNFQTATVEDDHEIYEIPVYNVAHYIIECCPWCEAEEVIFAEGITACPDCGKLLAPCSMCCNCSYEICPYGCDGSENDEHKKISNRKITEEERRLYAVL